MTTRASSAARTRRSSSARSRSKLSSTGYLGIGYMWTESFSTSLGYRYLYEDYEHSAVSGPGTFRYKATMHGPTLAMGWKF